MVFSPLLGSNKRQAAAAAAAMALVVRSVPPFPLIRLGASAPLSGELLAASTRRRRGEGEGEEPQDNNVASFPMSAYELKHCRSYDVRTRHDRSGGLRMQQRQRRQRRPRQTKHHTSLVVPLPRSRRLRRRSTSGLSLFSLSLVLVLVELRLLAVARAFSRSWCGRSWRGESMTSTKLHPPAPPCVSFSPSHRNVYVAIDRSLRAFLTSRVLPLSVADKFG